LYDETAAQRDFCPPDRGAEKALSVKRESIMDENREIIIMVDDDITNLTTAREGLKGRYKVVTAPSGEKLFFLLSHVKPALILLDINIPDMDGYEIMEQLKKNEETALIPVIFLTSKSDPESEIKGLELGAVDYITRPFSRDLLVKRIDMHIVFEKQRKELLRYNLSLESEIDRKARTVIELQNAILTTISELVERRDSVTGGHIERTQLYLSLLTGFLLEHGVYTKELFSWDIDLFIMSSQLHDVGKISIRDDVLMRPGQLSRAECEEMKKHTIYGVDIIKGVARRTSESEFLSYAEILAGSHHERWDGSGYPAGLKGEEIPLQGRLMALIDVFDALTNERPYKEAYSHEVSVEIIRNESGYHFDPLITDVFLEHEKEFTPEGSINKIFNAQYDNLESVLNMVTTLVSTRGDVSFISSDRVMRNIEVFLDCLSKNEKYRDEISSWDRDIFLLSSQLHDVGNIAVSDKILSKNAKLSDAEFESVRKHAGFGVKVIEQIKANLGNNTLLSHAEKMAGSHHEKWDGTGYPYGLSGEDIPLQGRIIALIDVYHALITDRPHRKRKTHREAIEIIINGSGTSFDPELVDIFLACVRGFDKG